MDENVKTGFLVIIVLILLCFLAVGTLWFNYSQIPKIGPKGDKGDPGDTPVKGIDYFDGIDGITPVKGIDYFDGLDGQDGQSITGPRGSKGDDGNNGRDCPPNKIPIITLNNLTRTTTRCLKYIYTINFTVNDPENDNMEIYIKIRSNQTLQWTLKNTIIGTDETYEYSFESYTKYSALYYLVEVWDGSDISLDYFVYTQEV